MSKLCFYSAVFLLVLCLKWRTSSGRPVQDQRTDDEAHCASLYRDLLLNITESLNSKDLCHGLIPSSKMTLRNEDTVQACAPNVTQNSSCATQRDSSFNESECQKNIIRDLTFYNATIQHYLRSNLNMPEKEVPLLKPTLGIIQTLLKDCSLAADLENYSYQEYAAKLWGNSSFANRQKMCKMMRGFHTRAITINRAVQYISSGDHRK